MVVTRVLNASIIHDTQFLIWIWDSEPVFAALPINLKLLFYTFFRGAMPTWGSSQWSDWTLWNWNFRSSNFLWRRKRWGGSGMIQTNFKIILMDWVPAHNRKHKNNLGLCSLDFILCRTVVNFIKTSGQKYFNCSKFNW